MLKHLNSTRIKYTHAYLEALAHRIKQQTNAIIGHVDDQIMIKRILEKYKQKLLDTYLPERTCKIIWFIFKPKLQQVNNNTCYIINPLHPSMKELSLTSIIGISEKT